MMTARRVMVAVSLAMCLYPETRITARATNLASGWVNLAMMTRIMRATTKLGSILMVRVTQPFSIRTS